MKNLVKEIQLQYKQIDENEAELKRKIEEDMPKAFYEDESDNYIDIIINKYVANIYLHFYYETYRFSMEFLYPILNQTRLTNMDLEVFVEFLVKLEEKQRQYYENKNL